MVLVGPARSADKALKGLKHLRGDDIGGLRHTRASEMSTEVRAQNHAHSVALKQQLNDWYKEQHKAVQKLSQGQQKLFRNLLKVQNDKRRIQRQTYIKKQEELRQKLRERAQKQKEEALKKAVQMNTLSLVLENNDDEVEHMKKSPAPKLPKIQKEMDLQDKEGVVDTKVLLQALVSRRKRSERGLPLKSIETKRPTYSESDARLSVFSPIHITQETNKSTVLPSIQSGITYSTSTSVVCPPKTDLDIIAAVSEANEVHTSHQPQDIPKYLHTRKRSKPRNKNRHRPTKSRGCQHQLIGCKVKEAATEAEEKKEPKEDKKRDPCQTQAHSVDDDVPSQFIDAKAAISNGKSNSTLKPYPLPPSTSELPDLKVSKKASMKKTRSSMNHVTDGDPNVTGCVASKGNLTENKLNSNQVLPPIGTEESMTASDNSKAQTRRKCSTGTTSTHSTKNIKKRQRLKQRQSLIDDMHKYHIEIASIRYTIPDFEVPVVERVVKYTRNSPGSLVQSDVSVKPAAEDFKLPSKKSAYLLQKALKREQGQMRPHQTKLDHFYRRVSEHIDNSKTASFPRPYISLHMDPKPAPKPKPTVKSRMLGISLESYHLRRDVNDLRNCRYLRFTGTALSNTQNDADLKTLRSPYNKRRLSSWQQSDLSYIRPKLNAAYP